jgi:phosphoribosyl 1,2-cyclic phosphate phosphodiesterase
MAGIELLFLGSGTSAGVPMIGCECPVCRSSDPRDHRTRPSVVISYRNCRVLVDTAPELRLQCVAQGVKRIDAVVYTHAHADHIMGLDDVRRFNTIKGGPLDVWADARTHHVLRQCFGYAFKEPDPELKVYRPHLEPRTIEGAFEIAGEVWRPIPLFHGEMPILGFRVGNLAYCTDVSRIPDESWPLLEGLEALVLDGLQFREHPTHFSIQQAVAAGERAGAKRVYLTHIAHSVHHESAGRTLPGHVELAYDGLVISDNIVR